MLGLRRIVSSNTTLLVTAAVLIAPLPPSVTGAGVPPLTLEVTPIVVVQGQSVRVRIRGGPPSRGTWRLLVGSTVVQAHPIAGGSQAFIGTSPLTSPGLLTIRAERRIPGGVERRIRQVRLRAATFGTRRLTVPPKLLDPSLAAMERRKVAKATSRPIPAPQWRGAFRLPVDGPVTSAYGVRSLYNGVLHGYHYGVDFRATTGSPVRAAAAGVVTLAEPLPLSGNIVMIDHGSGIFTTYQHLSAIAVQREARVARGQIIGRVGSTGLSTGPHLHWGMRVNGVRVDPLYWTKDSRLTAP